jgi:hypothetical protein
VLSILDAKGRRRFRSLEFGKSHSPHGRGISHERQIQVVREEYSNLEWALCTLLPRPFVWGDPPHGKRFGAGHSTGLLRSEMGLCRALTAPIVLYLTRNIQKRPYLGQRKSMGIASSNQNTLVVAWQLNEAFPD